VIVEYEPAQRGELAALMERVWRAPQDEAALAWWHEAPETTTLLEVEDGAAVATVSMSLVTLQLQGERVRAGVATRLATDPAAQASGHFARLQRESERRAEEAGARLLLVVPNAASAPIFRRWGWGDLEPLRVRFRALAGRRAPRVAELRALPPREGGLVRDDAYLRWRIGRGYELLQDERGYCAVGRRGRLRVVAATAGDPPLPGRALTAGAGVPTRKRFAVLARSLGEPLPPRVSLELGDLDFL